MFSSLPSFSVPPRPACGARTLAWTLSLPKKVQKIFVVYVTVLSAALYALLCYQGVIMTKTHILNKLVTASSGIPNWIFSIAVPISAAFYIIRSVQYAVITMKRLDAPEASEEQLNGGAD